MPRAIRTPAQKAKEKLRKKAAETALDDLLPPKTKPLQFQASNPPSTLFGESLRARLLADLQRGRRLAPSDAFEEDEDEDDEVQLTTTQIDGYEERPHIPYVSLEGEDDYFTVEAMSGEIHRIRRAPPNLGRPPLATPQRYSLMTQRSDDGFEVQMVPNDDGSFANNEIASAMQAEMERLFEEMNTRSGKPPPEIKRDEALPGKIIAGVLIAAMIVTLYFR